MSGEKWQEYLNTSKDKFTGKYNSNEKESQADIPDFFWLNEVTLGEARNKTTGGTIVLTNERLAFQLACNGKGAFGKVIAVIHRERDIVCACKVLNKTLSFKEKQVRHMLSEKKIMSAMDFVFIVKMEYAFQDPASLYLVIEFVNGGDLFQYMKSKPYTLPGLLEEQARSYAAQVILAIEYLHNVNCLYRDLKPENVMLTETGYIKLIDFGFAKVVPERTYTFCGTLDYCAPELFLQKGYHRSVDMWTIGILIYEMITGFPPFHQVSGDMIKFIDMVLSTKPKFPSRCSKEARDLMKRLLTRDPSNRIGCQRKGMEEVKAHKWFGPITVEKKKFPKLDWNMIWTQKEEQIYKPITSTIDRSSADDEPKTIGKPASKQIDVLFTDW